MGAPYGTHPGREEEHVVLGDSDSPYALRNLNLAISGALIAHEHTSNTTAQGAFSLPDRGDVQVASVALFDINGLVRFQWFRTTIGRGTARRFGRVVPMRHRLGARWCWCGRGGGCEGGEDVSGESAGDTETGVLPELLGDAELAPGKEYEKDAEGIRDTVLYDAGGDVACG